jgi:hypothetical protein
LCECRCKGSIFADSRSREKILISKKVHVEGTDKEWFLSQFEQHMLCWLAIVCELVHLRELHSRLVAPKPMGELLEAVDGLLRRSMIESGQRAGSFRPVSVFLTVGYNASMNGL